MTIIIEGEQKKKQGRKKSNKSNEKRKKNIKLNTLSVKSYVSAKPCHLSIFLLSPLTLCEKCPNTWFLVLIRENTDQKNPIFGHFSGRMKHG